VVLWLPRAPISGLALDRFCRTPIPSRPDEETENGKKQKAEVFRIAKLDSGGEEMVLEFRLRTLFTGSYLSGNAR